MSPLPKSQLMLRRACFFTVYACITLVATCLFYDWLQRTGFTPAKWTLLGLFFCLTTGLSFGFTQSLFGFIIVISRPDRLKITRNLPLNEADESKRIQSKIALLFPVYNEDSQRFYAGVEAIYRALKAAGLADHFSFFILSDSTEINRWIDEEKEWLNTTNTLNAHGRLSYRHRISNLNQKSGNVGDFCRRWGSHFDHMICFDADSLMSPDCILKLVRLMEANPKAGIIQTMPGLFGAQTLFARLQQFANRIHGEMSGAGLNFWQQSEGNYWGHNAIIRLEPFIKFCTLPELPGPRPLGGRVLSHDFVEAALMRKAGYEVWLAYDVEGSFEELPPTLLDFAQRDRRWCQGNLQHAWIAFFGRIPLINRIHMLNGIYAYMAAPLWLLFLCVSTLAVYSWNSSDLTLFIRSPQLPFSPGTLETHGMLVLTITLGMIFLPKLFTIVRLIVEPAFRRQFGGFFRATVSVVIEVLAFSLMAPALMLFHTSFVTAILTGNKVAWNAQNRDSTHTTWLSAIRVHRGQMVVGMLWAILSWKIDPVVFYTMSPVLLGWMIAAPFSVMTSHTDASLWLRAHGFLMAPEEIRPPAIIEQLRACETSREIEPTPIKALRNEFGLIQVILDPYINALHLSFLPSRKNQTTKTKVQLEALKHKLIAKGAPGLNAKEKNRILNDPRTVRELHRSIWTLPEEELHRWWRLAISRYSRQSLYTSDFELIHNH